LLFFLVEEWRDLFVLFESEQGITKLHNYYNIRFSQILSSKHYPSLKPILQHFQYSLPDLLSTLYPHHAWLQWNFKSLNVKPTISTSLQKRHYLYTIANFLNLQVPQHWYSIKPSQCLQFGRFHFLQSRHGGVLQTITRIFPELDWHVWEFEHLRHSHWLNWQHRYTFLSWFGREKNIRSSLDWYKVSLEDLKKESASFLQFYDGSLRRALCDVFPSKGGRNEVWRFIDPPRFSLFSHTKCRGYLEWLGDVVLHFMVPDGFYALKLQMARKLRGSMVYWRFDGSGRRALNCCFPEFRWLDWLFPQMRWRFWQVDGIRSQFLSWIEGELEIGEMEDWYDISQLRLASVLKKSSRSLSLPSFLVDLYPGYSWERERFLGVNCQRWLEDVFRKEIYPSLDVIGQYHHPLITFFSASLSRRVELDIFVPALSLAFEYQGKHHYASHPLYGNYESFSSRDEEKRMKCEKAGIKIIQIPHLWDGRKETLRYFLPSHEIK